MKDKLDAMLENYGAAYCPTESVQKKILEKLRRKQWCEITFIAPMKLMRQTIRKSMEYVRHI